MKTEELPAVRLKIISRSLGLPMVVLGRFPVLLGEKDHLSAVSGRGDSHCLHSCNKYTLRACISLWQVQDCVRLHSPGGICPPLT